MTCKERSTRSLSTILPPLRVLPYKSDPFHDPRDIIRSLSHTLHNILVAVNYFPSHFPLKSDPASNVRETWPHLSPSLINYDTANTLIHIASFANKSFSLTLTEILIMLSHSRSHVYVSRTVKGCLSCTHSNLHSDILFALIVVYGFLSRTHCYVQGYLSYCSVWGSLSRARCSAIGCHCRTCWGIRRVPFLYHWGKWLGLTSKMYEYRRTGTSICGQWHDSSSIWFIGGWRNARI